MTEQTMTFCQIVLKDELLNEIKNDPYGLGWDKIVEKHMKYYPEDLLPIPFHDPDPQVYPFLQVGFLITNLLEGYSAIERSSSMAHSDPS